MKYAFIERHRRVWPISVQCRVLQVSVAGFKGNQLAGVVVLLREQRMQRVAAIDNTLDSTAAMSGSLVVRYHL